MSMLKILAVVLCLAVSLQAPNPPTMPTPFQIAFDEANLNNGSTVRVNGQWYYDVANNRQRVDRTNGRYSSFCGSVLPNTTTPCTHLTVDNKRWIIFSQKKQCCLCCDAAHGCGVLKKDWLADAEYLGVEKILDTNYNKWNATGRIFWVTDDDRVIPRRLDEGQSHVTDYLVHTFTTKALSDSVFEVPSYCTDECPATTVCGKFRGESAFVAQE